MYAIEFMASTDLPNNENHSETSSQDHVTSRVSTQYELTIP